jgi:hypothetical protein
MKDRENSLAVSGEKDHFPIDNGYFNQAFERFQGYVNDVQCSPERVGELARIVKEVRANPEAVFLKIVSSQERSIAFFLGQMEREIGEGQEKGSLTTEEADEWRRRFCFSQTEAVGRED